MIVDFSNQFHKGDATLTLWPLYFICLSYMHVNRDRWCLFVLKFVQLNEKKKKTDRIP